MIKSTQPSDIKEMHNEWDIPENNKRILTRPECHILNRENKAKSIAKPS
jgi:hypothetical protein